MAIVYVFIIVGTVAVDLLLSTWLMMAFSAYLHSHWWDVIPALGFPQAFLIGLALICFSTITGVTEPSVSGGSILSRVVLSLVIVPFVLVWTIGSLNNEMIPAMPDIAFGVAFVTCLIGVGYAIVTGIMVKAIERFQEG